LKQSIAVAFLMFAFFGSASFWKLNAQVTPALKIKEVPFHDAVHLGRDVFQQFPESFPIQVAVFWTRPASDPESALPLVHSLKAMGIPFFVTRDLAQAIRHRLVILYPSVDSHTFTEPQADQLTVFVRQGGFIFAQNVFWGGLQQLFGISIAPRSSKRNLGATTSRKSSGAMGTLPTLAPKCWRALTTEAPLCSPTPSEKGRCTCWV
jgi:hypothetical protein